MRSRLRAAIFTGDGMLTPLTLSPTREHSAAGALAVLTAAVFVIALGYGAILPALPVLLGNWLAEANRGDVAWYTGTVSGLYMFALFAFSPMWGALSDRIGRRPVILTGLAGYIVVLALFHTYHSLLALYANRLLAGAFASAVLPVTAAFISDASTADGRLRWFALTSAATLAGFLLGPAMSGLMTGAPEPGSLVTFSLFNPAGLPVMLAAALGIPVWIAAYVLLPRSAGATLARTNARPAPASGRRPLYALLALTLIVMLGLGAFEVGIALEGQQMMKLTPGEISVLFMACSGTMAVVQALLFVRPSVQSVLTRHAAVASGFVLLAVGFALLPMARGFYELLLAVVLIASASGALLPALSHLISVRSDSSAGTMLGLQASAASLGQGVGSVAGGWLFGSFMMSSFWIAAVVMAGTALVAAGVARTRQPAPVRAER